MLFVCLVIPYFVKNRDTTYLVLIGPIKKVQFTQSSMVTVLVWSNRYILQFCKK